MRRILLIALVLLMISAPTSLHAAVQSPADATGAMRVSAAKPTLRRGSTGPAVRELQQRLNIWIAKTPRAGLRQLAVNSVFDAKTELAVRTFQKLNNLPATGVVGPRTWAALPPLPGQPAPSQGVPAPAAARIHNFTFEPARLVVKVGQTVIWSNKDPVAHTITQGVDGQPGGAFNSGLVMAGNQFKHTFTKAGTYAYYCTPHPWMTGTVVVTR